jgi:hypothetical protein
MITNIEYPSKADGSDDTTISEALDPKGKCETSPSTNAVSRAFPKEYGDGATCDSSDHTREDEHAADSVAGRMYRRNDPKLED